MRRWALVTTIALQAVPAWGGDARLDLGFQVDTNYEDNVLSDPRDEDGDFSVNVGPTFNAYDRRGDLRWKLDYNPTYLKYHEFDELDDWEHYAFGEISWVPNERTRFFANAEYVDASSFQRLAAADPSQGDTGVQIATQGVERTAFEGGVNYGLSRRMLGTIQFARYENDYELATRQDVSVSSASLQLLYSLSLRNRLGLNVRYQLQESQLPGARVEETNYYNVSAIWEHVFDPTLTLNVSAGPALVEPDEGEDIELTVRRFPFVLGANGIFGPAIAFTCPTLEDGTPFLSRACLTVSPLSVGMDLDEFKTIGVIGDVPEGGGDEITYFAAISLTKQWQHVRGAISYTRDVSTGSDIGGSTVRDYVSASLNWRVTRRFRTDLLLSYQRFESATEDITFVTALQPVGGLGEAAGLRAVLIDNQREDEIYWARIRFSYELTPRTECSFSVIWQTQMSELPPQPELKVDRLLVVIGFTYKFSGIPLGI